MLKVVARLTFFIKKKEWKIGHLLLFSALTDKTCQHST